MCKLFSTLLIALIFTGFDIEAQDDDSIANPYTPSLNRLSLRGLYEVKSAEPLGEGRLSFALSSSWYQQQKESKNTPNLGTNVFTTTVSLSFGINSYFDLYGAVSGFGLQNYTGSESPNGIGTVQAGISTRLPLTKNGPVNIGGSASVIGGTSSFQINTNNTDGYNYFETRTGYDFEGTLLQTFRIGKEGACVKIHLNEGTVVSLQSEKSTQLVLGSGIEINPHPVITIGTEINTRSSINNPQFTTDPFWVSPLIQIHTPFNCQIAAGVDMALNRKRTDNTRALEPYRIFADIGVSFDLLASKRKNAFEKRKAETEQREKERLEREEMNKRNKELQIKADSITVKAHNDSLQMARLREQEKLRADSMAAKARQDSIKLAEVNAKLKEEKSKRSDAEKQLLSTGLLLLDAVYFESGKADISINSKPYLTIISKMLMKYPKLQIEVAGHTDNIGKIASNLALSQARADAVRYFLIQSSPDLSMRLTARGYGPSQPKAENKTADGRKVNRRVELQVLNKDVLREYNSN
jgi:outer membrane protein OmpA-like peptidoglycan-associated protein